MLESANASLCRMLSEVVQLGNLMLVVQNAVHLHQQRASVFGVMVGSMSSIGPDVEECGR